MAIDKTFLDESGLSLYDEKIKDFIKDSGGNGHIIMNQDGSKLTGRSFLQFNNATLTDDATNDKTVVSVDVTNQITQSETKPVSSGAVYTAIGNIETLLASI